MKVSFERMFSEALKLDDQRACASSYEEEIYYRKMFLGYLSACHWSEEEFDSAVVEYVNANWKNRNKNHSLN